MPHLNELQEKFGDKGLSVVGVTLEGKEPTEKWVKDKGVTYAYAYDKGGKLMRSVGASGFPSSVLLDPTGRIVWQGHPSELKEQEIETALAGALKQPIFAWPEDAAAVRKALAKGQFKKALDESGKLQDESYARAIQGLIDGRVQSLKASMDDGNYLVAFECAGLMKKQLAGLPAADEAAAATSKIGADAEAQKVMKAQAKVRKLRETKLNTPKDVAELLEEVEKLGQKFAGTAAGRDAEAFASELRKAMG